MQIPAISASAVLAAMLLPAQATLPKGGTTTGGTGTTTTGSSSNGMGSTRGTPQSNAAPFACDLRASLPGYRSDLISMSSRRNLDDPNVGTIFLHRLANVEGLTTSATAALAPKDAKKAFEKGLDAAKKAKVDEAQADFRKAAELYPRYAYAWFELGRVYEQREHIADARDAYNKSIAADSKFVNPYERLYLLSLKERRPNHGQNQAPEPLRFSESRVLQRGGEFPARQVRSG
jgi:tetratricopeptide (TPR) repeat protein